MKEAPQVYGESKDYSFPGLGRGMAMLEFLARHPEGLKLVDISQKLELTNNAVFRIGPALVGMGYLRRDSKTKKFTLSRKLLGLGLSTVYECNVVECAMRLEGHVAEQVRWRTASSPRRTSARSSCGWT